MRHRHSKLRMGLRGRSGFLTYMVVGIAAVVALFYAWNNLIFRPPSKITYASVQGAKPGPVETWDRQGLEGFVMEEPPIGLNKEIEIQMANEKWKQAKALQDRIDEERLMEEQSAQHTGRKVDHQIQKLSQNLKYTDNASQQKGSVGPNALLYQQADPLDGDYFSNLERLVHLDLKGAPPLVSYLEKLFPVLKKLGATGLLVEYEDMFPYTGNISILASGNAYSLSDLQRIQTSAKANGLEIIPLVQTFGHMEFVLKYKQFISLRELEFTPQVITPVKEESYNLLFDILNQVLRAHPDAQRVHLGCDEVYQLGQGQSNNFITSQHTTIQKLFLRHVSRVAHHIKDTFPKLKPLIWDDWLRRMPYEVLADSGLPGLIEPVVWYYQHNILERIPLTVWDTYARLFPAVWVASAFKGATGSAQILTNASVHLDNNLQWVSIMRTLGLHKKKVAFRGVMLTGWQRYDHFATLCELFPVGLPSLALSLQAIKTGGFGIKEETTASRSLNCSGRLDLQFPAVTTKGAEVSQDCSFPGSAVYYSVQQLWGIMEVYQQDRGLQERISGWMTDYHYQHSISNPGQMNVLAHKLTKVVDKLRSLVSPMQDSMLHIYDRDTVNEWITTNLQDRANNINKLLDKAKKFLERRDWPGRPFPEQSSALTQMEVQPAMLQTGGSLASNSRSGQTGGKGQYSQQQGVPSNIQGSAVSHDTQARQVNVGAPVNLPGTGNRNSNIAHNAALRPLQGVGPTKHGVQTVYNQGGSMLSQALLQKANAFQQAGPNGPGKMPYYMPPVQNAVNPDSQGRFPGKQQMRLQAGQAAGMQGIGQFVRGLPHTHSVQGQQNPIQNHGQSLQGLPPNFQGAGQGQHNQLQNVHGLGQGNQQQVLQIQQRVAVGPNKEKPEENKVEKQPVPEVRGTKQANDGRRPDEKMSEPNQLNSEMQKSKGAIHSIREEIERPEKAVHDDEKGAHYLKSFAG